MDQQHQTPATLVKKVYLYQGERLTTTVIPQEVRAALLNEVESDSRASPLSSKQKEALRLHFWEGLTLQQAGTRLQVSESSVWIREQRGIQRLKTSKDEVESFRDILWDHNLVSSPLSVVPPGRGRPRKSTNFAKSTAGLKG